MATKPATTEPKKASSVKSGASSISVSSDRSKGVAPKKPAKSPAKKPVAPPKKPRSAPGKKGRPKDSPDVWTPEHIAHVADLLWEYVEKTACPSLADFCLKNRIRRQRLYEFPELTEVKDFLYEKRETYLERQGMSLTKDHGPRGAFILKALANIGQWSWVEKTETKSEVAQVSVFLPDNGRGDGPAPKDAQ